jgi:predicted acyltransferase
MVGVSMAFSMKKYGGPGLKYKIVSRTLKLFALGIFTQGAFIWLGGDGFDVKTVRIPGILQRIAFAYFVVAPPRDLNPQELLLGSKIYLLL